MRGLLVCGVQLLNETMVLIAAGARQMRASAGFGSKSFSGCARGLVWVCCALWRRLWLVKPRAINESPEARYL